MTIRTLSIDDHRIVLRGIEQILQKTPDIRVTGIASNAHEALERIAGEEFDVVLLDISMPDRNGLELLKLIRERRPRLPVLILSMHPEEQYAVRALRAGASGYLTKESALEELIEAIRRVSQGRKYVSASLAEKLASELEPDVPKPPHERLSDREFQVMQMIGAGRKNLEIARDLFVSPKTVATYKTRIFQKTGLKNNAELIRYLLEHDVSV
ncbi:MAG TPA: response regulator transcription factor [Candidatus Deferrimicrobiaceae bacterium]